MLIKVKSSKIDNCRDWSQRIPTFRTKTLRQRKKRVLRIVSFSDEGPLLETLEFFEISHGSYQLLNFLPYLLIYHGLREISDQISPQLRKHDMEIPRVFVPGEGFCKLRCPLRNSLVAENIIEKLELQKGGLELMP